NQNLAYLHLDWEIDDAPSDTQWNVIEQIAEYGTKIEHFVLEIDDQNLFAKIAFIFSHLSHLKYFCIRFCNPDMFELFGPFSKLIIDPFLPEIALSIPESLTTFDFFSAEVEFGPEALSEF